MKLVSVIIPAYNHQDYIKDCIESVLSQTHRNLEVIVQDDCSTDNTAAEIKKIRDPRLTVIFSKKNQGVVKTLNDLIGRCHGDYIATIGSDDMWEPNKIEKQLAIFRQNPKLGGVFTGVKIIDEHGNVNTQDLKGIFDTRNMPQGERLKLFFEKGNHLCHSSSLIPTRVMQKIGKYNPAYRQLHDYDYWTRLICDYNIHIVDEPLTIYRRNHDETNTSISSNKLENIVRTVNESQNINAIMIINAPNNIFRQSFRQSFRNKDSKTNEEIFCEKFFTLLKMDLCGRTVTQPAIQKVFNTTQENIFPLLEEKYRYTIKDFYKETGKALNLYPPSLNSDYRDEIEIKNQRIRELEQAIDRIYDSKSWKVTAPIRLIQKILRAKKC